MFNNQSKKTEPSSDSKNSLSLTDFVKSRFCYRIGSLASNNRNKIICLLLWHRTQPDEFNSMPLELLDIAVVLGVSQSAVRIEMELLLSDCLGESDFSAMECYEKMVMSGEFDLVLMKLFLEMFGCSLAPVIRRELEVICKKYIRIVE